MDVLLVYERVSWCTHLMFLINWKVQRTSKSAYFLHNIAHKIDIDLSGPLWEVVMRNFQKDLKFGEDRGPHRRYEKRGFSVVSTVQGKLVISCMAMIGYTAYVELIAIIPDQYLVWQSSAKSVCWADHYSRSTMYVSAYDQDMFMETQLRSKIL